MKIQISKIMLVAMLFSATAMFGQTKEVRIALKGNAVAVGTVGKAGLEINGKLVVPKNYASFQTDGNGTLFAVETNDGKFGIVDRNGKFIYPCTYYKAQITGNMIRLQETENSQPKFYKVTSPAVEEKVTKLHPLHFYPVEKYRHDKAEDNARRILFWNPFAAYEVVSNNKGRLELWVQCSEFQELKTLDEKLAVAPVAGKKKIIEATSFYLLSDTVYFNKTGNWVFVVQEGYPGSTHQKKGLLVLNIFNNNGKKAVQKFVSIPVENSWIGHCEEMVSVTSFSGATRYYTYLGQEVNYQTFNNCLDRKRRAEQEKKAAETEKAQAQSQNSNSASTSAPSGNTQTQPTQPAETKKPEFQEETYDKTYKVNFKSDDKLLVITEVAVGKTQTRIIAKYTSEMNNYCCYFYNVGDSRGMVIIADGKKYLMTAQKGLPYENEGKYCMKNGETITVTMYFDALPDNIQTFLLQEGDSCYTGSWCVKNVAFKKKKGFFDKLNDTLDDVNDALK
jgi:hypothetical protein